MNPRSEDQGWTLQIEPKYYDYYQEVARAGFADMLHDKERNQKYEQALISAIKKIHSTGQRANVLDIGTGTGLLSMMAARNGADSVVACEAFRPMGECALKVIEQNGFRLQIKVIPKRSTELTVGEDGDLKQKFNILVTEVFDTELIGEGALSTFQHAHQYLLTEDAIVVPDSATIYAQVVESPLAQNWNKLRNIYDNDGELLVSVPDFIKDCPGAAAVHDIQLSQLPLSSFRTIISPKPVLKFDWSGRTPFIFKRVTVNSVSSECAGVAQVVFMWWELQMDTEGEIILSCAPKWAHPAMMKVKESEMPWRDHWMQAIYYLPKPLNVRKDQEVHLISCHDEYSLWFNLNLNLSLSKGHHKNPFCNCEFHSYFSRTRIGQINDTRRNKKYLSLFEKHIDSESVVLIMTEGFYLGLAAAKTAKKVYVFEKNKTSRNFFEYFISHNKFKNVEVVNELKFVDLSEVSVVLSEPYFMSSLLPWDNLHYLHSLRNTRCSLGPDVKIFPEKVAFKAVAVHFTDLYKIRAPLGTCEGLEMNHFDRLIEASRQLSDEAVEAQPLWEYPGIALTEEVEITTIDLVDPPDSMIMQKGTFNMQGVKGCNGVALWVDWDMDGSPQCKISTGPLTPIEVGEKIDWDMYTRQGVYLFPKEVKKDINYTFSYDFDKGSVIFTCG